MLTMQHREGASAVILELVGAMSGGPDTLAVIDAVKSRVKHGARRFVFDLGQVKTMNSMGVSALVEMYASIKRSEGAMVILSPSERVRSVLKINGLIPEVLTIVDTEDEATAHFAQHPHLATGEGER